jgi:hypothetical protein
MSAASSGKESCQYAYSFLEAAAGKAPAEKYTVRLMGADAARLEGRAQTRGVTAVGRRVAYFTSQILMLSVRGLLQQAPVSRRSLDWGIENS